MTTPPLNRCAAWQPLAGLLAQAGAPAALPYRQQSIEVASIDDDSRAVGPGSCFVAVRGARADGHAFIAQAVAAGAVAVVAEEPVIGLPDDVACILVRDSRDVLARMAAAFHRLPAEQASGYRLVGVTGTNGKTTVSFLLRSILRSAGERPALFGTVEYDVIRSVEPAALTTPGSLEICARLRAARDAGATAAIMEVSSHALEQRRVSGLAFSGAVFTNLSGDHLDYHGSMEAYEAAKRSLFSALTPTATAVVNADDAAGARMADAARRAGARVRTFSLREGADVCAEVCSSSATHTHLRIRGLATTVDVGTSLIGHHNVANVLAAAAMADALQISVSDIEAGVANLSGVPGRLERVSPVDHPFHVYVDYAHTDAALENVLSVLRPLAKGRLICLFGCGGDRDRTKRPRMAQAVAAGAEVAVITSDNPRTEDPLRIIEDILSGWPAEQGCRAVVEPDRARAIGLAIAEAREGDIVLLAGKGHEDYQIVGGQRRAFDDRREARAVLEARSRDGRPCPLECSAV
ncbi:MAG: UDP-N-acetylmuramoyl-L-alanyl-D-glutamate--2,6-diaminopimelate ligase [Phycisphaerales bacterium]|nr:MAG: UDP-N-acetylmuramoyl-L-alanyl-D-glutamate--2,6-diaminopimelate ligase [Phycisphaerales bacterium]